MNERLENEVLCLKGKCVSMTIHRSLMFKARVRKINVNEKL